MLTEIINVQSNKSTRKSRNPMIAPAALTICALANGGLCDCAIGRKPRRRTEKEDCWVICPKELLVRGCGQWTAQEIQNPEIPWDD